MSARKIRRGGQVVYIKVSDRNNPNNNTNNSPNIRAFNPNANYTSISDAEAQDYVDDQESNYDINTRLAIKQYISAAVDASGHSRSQNMNWKLKNDLPLNANEKYMYNKLINGMQPLQKDAVLHRADHDDFLRALGVDTSRFNNMTDAQLKQELVGLQYQTKGITSTSYDIKKNPFINGAQSGGREVMMTVNTQQGTQVMFVNKKQAETLLNENTNVRITDAKFTGVTVYPRLGGAKRQIHITVDAW